MLNRSGIANLIKVKPTDRVISKQIEVPNSAWLDVSLSLLEADGYGAGFYHPKIVVIINDFTGSIAQLLWHKHRLNQSCKMFVTNTLSRYETRDCATLCSPESRTNDILKEWLLFNMSWNWRREDFEEMLADEIRHLNKQLDVSAVFDEIF